MLAARRATVSLLAAAALVVGVVTPVQAAPGDGFVEITVLAPGGEPFVTDAETERVRVKFDAVTSFTEVSVTIGEDGTAEASVPPGDYQVYVFYDGEQNVLNGWDGGGATKSGSTVHSVTADSTTAIPLLLREGGSISLEVTGDDAPLSSVTGYLDGEGLTFEQRSEPVQSFDVETQTWSVVRLPPTTYHAKFVGATESGPRLVAEWFGGELDYRESLSTFPSPQRPPLGDEIVVNEGDEIVAESLSLEVMSTISGSVDWPGTEPDYLTKWIVAYLDGVKVGERQVASHGRFTFSDVARYEGDDWSFCVKSAVGWAETCWSESGEVPFTEAGSVAAVPLGAVEGIDITVVESGGVRVVPYRDLDGAGGASPVENTEASVRIFRLSADETRYDLDSPGLGRTYQSAMWVGSVFPGTFIIELYDESRPQLGRTWLREDGSTSPYLADAHEFVVESGEVLDLDAVMRPLTRSFDRVSGSDRFSTAVEISKITVSDDAVPAPVVYITNGLNYPDALSAGPIASQQGGTMLLVSPTAIPASVAAELRRLQPERIVVVGGTMAVSAAVQTQLAAFVDNDPSRVQRVSGGDRYTVSRSLVAEGLEGSTGMPIFIATGRNYPDALAAGPAAAAVGGAVLLVDGAANSLDAATRALLDDLDPSAIVIVGGKAGVSEGILQALSTRYGSTADVFRVGGPDRYSVAVLLNQVVFAESSVAFVARGDAFADALAGGPLVAAYGAPLYLTQASCLPRVVDQDITALRASTVVILGGTSAVSRNVARGTVCASGASAPVTYPADDVGPREAQPLERTTRAHDEW